MPRCDRRIDRVVNAQRIVGLMAPLPMLLARCFRWRCRRWRGYNVSFFVDVARGGARDAKKAVQSAVNTEYVVRRIGVYPYCSTVCLCLNNSVPATSLTTAFPPLSSPDKSGGARHAEKQCRSLLTFELFLMGPDHASLAPPPASSRSTLRDMMRPRQRSDTHPQTTHINTTVCPRAPPSPPTARRRPGAHSTAAAARAGWPCAALRDSFR